MKLADETIIQNGEKELTRAIKRGLDWSAVQKIFKEKYQIKIQDDPQYRQGDIVVFNNKAAFRLSFDVRVNFSVLIDRSGGFLSLTAAENTREESPYDKVTKSGESLGQSVSLPTFITHDEDQNETGEEDLLELTEVVKKTAAV